MEALKLQPERPAFIVGDLRTLEKVVSAYAARQKRIYADTETTSLNPRAGKLVAIQMWQGVGLPVIIDWRKFQGDDANLAALMLSEDGPLGGYRWVFHNAAFDLSWLSSVGIYGVSKVYDTQVAEQVIYGVGMDEKRGELALKDLAAKYAGFDMSKDGREWFYDLDTRTDTRTFTVDGAEFEELYRPWDEPFPDEEVQYMVNDVKVLPAIYDCQIAELSRRKMVKVAELEMRVVPAIAYMQGCGVRIDVDQWRGVIQEQEAESHRLEEELLTSDLAKAILDARRREYEAQKGALLEWQLERDHFIEGIKSEWMIDDADDKPKWGEVKKEKLAAWKARHPRPPTPKADLLEINLGSSQQLKQGLSELGINLPDTEKETLEKAAPRFPVLKPLLAFRQAEKIVSTYGEKLLARVEADGRIHPSYQQIGAETGRMSCRMPNWQNIPARTEVGKKLRECVIAEDGWMLLTADYSIIELRILAELAKNQVMLDMFASGADLHNFTTRRMFNLGPEVTDDEIEGKREYKDKPYRLAKYNNLKARDIAKTINYGVAYGQSAFGFSEKFQVDVDTAQGFIDSYYAGFTGLGAFLTKLGNFTEKHLYSQTVLGRKRYYELPEPDDTYEGAKLYRRMVNSIRRKGANHPIQGTSADITKEALALIYEWLVSEEGSGVARIVAVVHDEIVLECREEDADYVKQRQGELMYQAARKYLPNVAIPVPDPHVGRTWEH
jgi:DNA polymerase-1